MKIHNYVGVGFCPRVFTHSVGINAYFGPRGSNYPLPTPNYGQDNKKYNMDY